MKRSAMPKRTKPIERKTTLAKINPAATKKRRARYRRLLAQMKKGEGYRLAMERADGHCEMKHPCCIDAAPWEAHHKTYRRLAREAADDLVIGCRPCHRYEEATNHAHRRRSHG